MKKSFSFKLFFLALFTIAAAGAWAQGENYQDGVYVGEHGFVKVRVTVAQGKIAAIEILQHGGGGKKYEDMVKALIPRMIEKQSADVDGITGATVSSENLTKAVENALQTQDKSAKQKEP